MNKFRRFRIKIFAVVLLGIVCATQSAPDGIRFPESASSSDDFSSTFPKSAGSSASGSFPKSASSSLTEFPESSRSEFPESAPDVSALIDDIIKVSRSGRDVQLAITGKDDLTFRGSNDQTLRELNAAGNVAEARNYVATKLCSLGVASCGAGFDTQGRRGGNYGLGNINQVSLVQPVTLKPVGGPIAAIPLNGGGSYYPTSSGGFGSYPSENKEFNNYNTQQGGFIGNSQCSCVPVSQCNSYDIVGGNGGSNYQPSGSSNNGATSGFGSPNYGHVGGGIDPRNNLAASNIQSNATIVSSDLARRVRSYRSSENEHWVWKGSEGSASEYRRNKREPPVFSNSNPRIVNGAVRGCYDDRLVCCRNPINNHGSSSNYYPSGGFQQRPVSNQYNPSNNGICGKRNSKGVNGRVLAGNYGGNSAEYGEYPWQVAILRKEGVNSVFVCGGSLIDSRHVLTAAHCIKKYRPEDLRVRMGDWDVSQDNEFYPHLELDVAAMAVHPEFYSGNLINDIAIVKINGFVDFGKYPHISPICLPGAYHDFSGSRCYVTGWGKDAFGSSGKFQRRLQEVDVPVIDNYECEQKLKRTRLGPNFTLHPGFICAGGEPEKDACKGDGGGPLSCEVGGVWQLTGIVSWGVGCGNYGTPGVYVKTSHYINWIRQTIQ